MIQKSKRVFVIFLFYLISNTGSYCQIIGPVTIHKAKQLITVGGIEADISGYTSEAIQLALDAIKSRGGGIVKLNPGNFMVIGPIRVPSNTSLIGAGKNTILKKCDGFSTNFIVDADWGMLKVIVNDATGFKKGMGIQLSDDLYNKNWDVTTAVITEIKDNVLYFDNATVHDYLSSLNGKVTNTFSIIEAVGVENVKIANLYIEGNKNSNDYINGCRGGGIYIHKSKACIVDNVTVNDFNGDSFSWQITENITINGCVSSNSNGHGFHPGTGSDHSIVENSTSYNNAKDGLFLCWRVQNGIFRNNSYYSNGRNGISVGHQDNFNVFENNHIYQNGYEGVLFRTETKYNSCFNNVFSNNVVENNGVKTGSSEFYVGGKTHDITISNNTIRSTGKGNQRIAVIIGKESKNIIIYDNKTTNLKEILFKKQN